MYKNAVLVKSDVQCTRDFPFIILCESISNLVTFIKLQPTLMTVSIEFIFIALEASRMIVLPSVFSNAADVVLITHSQPYLYETTVFFLTVKRTHNQIICSSIPLSDKTCHFVPKTLEIKYVKTAGIH